MSDRLCFFEIIKGYFGIVTGHGAVGEHIMFKAAHANDRWHCTGCGLKITIPHTNQANDVFQEYTNQTRYDRDLNRRCKSVPWNLSRHRMNLVELGLLSIFPELHQRLVAFNYEIQMSCDANYGKALLPYQLEQFQNLQATLQNDLNINVKANELYGCDTELKSELALVFGLSIGLNLGHGSKEIEMVQFMRNIFGKLREKKAEAKANRKAALAELNEMIMDIEDEDHNADIADT